MISQEHNSSVLIQCPTACSCAKRHARATLKRTTSHNKNESVNSSKGNRTNALLMLIRSRSFHFPSNICWKYSLLAAKMNRWAFMLVPRMQNVTSLWLPSSRSLEIIFGNCLVKVPSRTPPRPASRWCRWRLTNIISFVLCSSVANLINNLCS